MSAAKQLKAAARAGVGKGAARAVRRQGRVPAVIYGGGEPPIAISLDDKETRFLILGGGFLTTRFDIDVEGTTISAIPRDFQLDPVKDFPLHVDFLRLSEGQTIRVFVPVHFENEEGAPGLKTGGTLNVVRHEVELIVPANDIPASITADLTGLEIGDSVRFSAANVPGGVKPVIQDRDFILATIAAPSELGDDGAEPAIADADAPEA